MSSTTTSESEGLDGREHGAAHADSPSSAPARSGLLAEVRAWARLFLLVGAFYAALTSLVAEGYYIPSGSMEPTLRGEGRGARGYWSEDEEETAPHAGDRVLALKGVYLITEPRRGDVIVFRGVEKRPEDCDRCQTEEGPPPESCPHAAPLLVKRVVGLPGETVELRDGHVLIDGHHLPPGVLPFDGDYEEWQGTYGVEGRPYQVPFDCYYVLGDRSDISRDSRYWGCVPRVNIRGKVVFRFWPANRAGPVH